MSRNASSRPSGFAARRLCCAILAATAVCYFAQPFSLRNFSNELNSTRFLKTAIEQSRNSRTGRTSSLRERAQRKDDARRLIQEKDKLKGRFFDAVPYPSF